MRSPSRAPLFATLYPGLCQVARQRGYALAIHGTLIHDLDLIAVPWVEDAVDAVTLRDALMEHVGACGYEELLRQEAPHLTEEQIEYCARSQPVDEKPHGRVAWNLYLGNGSKIDLSVMPRITNG